MPREAPLRRTDTGTVPEGEGWFVLNAREARWLDEGPMGLFTPFAGAARFPQIGINLVVINPGQPSSMYHGEDEQEDFLVLSGACLLLIEGEERHLEAWDFVHCPAWTEHVFVGAGSGPCAILMIGSRTPDAGVIYPSSALAQRYGAGVEKSTDSPEEAYRRFPERRVPTAYRDGWLPKR